MMEGSPLGLPLARRSPPMALDAPAPLRIRRDWPGAIALPLGQGLPLAGRQRSPAAAAARDADVARRFETLITATLLRSARAADLGDDGMGATAEPIRDLIDNSRAEAIARAAPLGVARLLQQQHAAPLGVARLLQQQHAAPLGVARLLNQQSAAPLGVARLLQQQRAPTTPP